MYQDINQPYPYIVLFCLKKVFLRHSYKTCSFRLSLKAKKLLLLRKKLVKKLMLKRFFTCIFNFFKS